MGWGAEVQLIQDHFTSKWPVGVPYAFDNTAFAQPTTGPWVELTISAGESSAATVGSGGLIRNTGIINVQVFTDVLTGSVEAYNIADTATDIFRNQTFSGINCLATTLERVGVVLKGNKEVFQLQINTPYKHDIPPGGIGATSGL